MSSSSGSSSCHPSDIFIEPRVSIHNSDAPGRSSDEVFLACKRACARAKRGTASSPRSLRHRARARALHLFHPRGASCLSGPPA
ncbi:UvrABC system protein A [Clarias magur]|uniref:UvrABC system protein A n=1 Tax=Clarias magur TaxID=1594786 RepID=A0A8J4TKR3_CLAMG|nr:UvrABC system protein A [Clarias magur]